VDVQKAGKELTVDALLTGRVVQHGDTIQVQCRPHQCSGQHGIWGEQYERKASDIISLQQQIAGDIADKLRSKLSGSEKQQVTKQGTQNADAYQLYVKGRYYWTKRTNADIKTAISYFNQSIDKDPGYAVAYSGLADAYAVLPNYGADPNDVTPKSNAAAEKALELDPTLAHPHAVLGANKSLYNWDFSGGEAEFRKAIELDPSDATAHQWFSEDLSSIGGRAQESIDEANRAHQLDPLSPIIGLTQAMAYSSDHQFDKAIESCKRVMADNPNFGRAHTYLASQYWAEHKYPQAIQELKSGSQLEGDKNAAEFTAALDAGFGSGGWPSALRKESKSHSRSASQKRLRFSLRNRGVICRFGRQGICFRVAQHSLRGTRRHIDLHSDRFPVRFPAFRSTLRRDSPQGRFAAIVTAAVLPSQASAANLICFLTKSAATLLKYFPRQRMQGTYPSCSASSAVIERTLPSLAEGNRIPRCGRLSSAPPLELLSPREYPCPISRVVTAQQTARVPRSCNADTSNKQAQSGHGDYPSVNCSALEGHFLGKSLL